MLEIGLFVVFVFVGEVAMDGFEPALRRPDEPGGLEPTLPYGGELYQGRALVVHLARTVGRQIQRVIYGDPLFEGSETQWNDFVPRFHYPEWCEFAFADGTSLGLVYEGASIIGMGTYGLVEAREALASKFADDPVTITEDYETLTNMSLDPGWSRRIASRIASVEGYLGTYGYRCSGDWRDTSTESTYDLRDLVITFENETRVYFTTSRSMKGLSLQMDYHDRLAIVFDERIARKAQLGPHNPHGELIAL